MDTPQISHIRSHRDEHLHLAPLSSLLAESTRSRTTSVVATDENTPIGDRLITLLRTILISPDWTPLPNHPYTYHHPHYGWIMSRDFRDESLSESPLHTFLWITRRRDILLRKP